MIEIPIAIWGIVGAIIASWGGVFLNNLYQLKVQKENHERELKTKAFTETINVIIASRFLFLRLPDSSPDDENDLFREHGTPPEFFIWATNQTIQAVCDFKTAVYQERKRLRAYDRPSLIFRNQCYMSFFGLADAEAKVIDCIRREIKISFNKKEYLKIQKAHYDEFIEIVGLKSPPEQETSIRYAFAVAPKELSDEQEQENR